VAESSAEPGNRDVAEVPVGVAETEAVEPTAIPLESIDVTEEAVPEEDVQAPPIGEAVPVGEEESEQELPDQTAATTMPEAAAPEGVFAEAAEALDVLESYRYRTLFTFVGSDRDEAEPGSIELNGAIAGEGRIYLMWRDLSDNTLFEVLRIQGETWVAEGGEWSAVPTVVAEAMSNAVSIYAPSVVWEGVFSRLEATSTYVGRERVDETSAHHFTSTHGEWGSYWDGELAEASGDIWIAEEGYPLKAHFTATGTDVDGKAGLITWVVEIRDVNQELELPLPPALPVADESPRQSQVGDWRRSVSVDPMDDSVCVKLALLAHSGPTRSGETPYLGLQFDDTGTMVFIRWGEYISSGTVNLETRLDTAVATRSRWYCMEGGSTTLYVDSTPDEDGFVHQLSQADQLIVRVVPYGSTAVTAFFNLAGLSDMLDTVPNYSAEDEVPIPKPAEPSPASEVDQGAVEVDELPPDAAPGATSYWQPVTSPEQATTSSESGIGTPEEGTQNAGGVIESSAEDGDSEAESETGIGLAEPSQRTQVVRTMRDYEGVYTASGNGISFRLTIYDADDDTAYGFLTSTNAGTSSCAVGLLEDSILLVFGDLSEVRLPIVGPKSLRWGDTPFVLRKR